MAYLHNPYYVYRGPHHNLPSHQQQLVFDEPGAINTLFISGLPDDVKAREIHNLFRRRRGFQSCQLKYTGRGDQVVAFATFASHHSAIAAMQELNGVKFDPQTGSVLHIELARSNSRRKHRPGSGPYVVIDNRTKTLARAQEVSSSDVDSDADEECEDGDDDSENEADKTESVSRIDPDYTAVAPFRSEQAKQAAEEGVGARACSTIFIANLGPNCTEDELKEALSQYPGFNALKIRAKGGMPVAFADFEETQQATTVMNDLQGSLFPSSDRGGVHIEYARSKMRKH